MCQLLTPLLMWLILHSCNIQKSQPAQPPPPPPPPGSFAKWNNESSRAAKEIKDNKKVHFNLETLNTRRLLARVVSEGAQSTSGSSSGAGPAPSGSRVSRVCENGGPVPLQPLPSSPLHSTEPPKEGELEELQEKIEEIRGQLRDALARRAELQTALAKERAAAVIPLTQEGPPTVTATICRSLVKDLEGKRWCCRFQPSSRGDDVTKASFFFFYIDPKAFTDVQNLLQSSCYCIIRLWDTIMLTRTAMRHRFGCFLKKFRTPAPHHEDPKEKCSHAAEV